MVVPGKVNPTGTRAPQPPGHQGNEGAYQGSPPMLPQHSTEVLHQRSKLPFCPARMAIGGFAITLMIGYFTLYSTKKKEDTALGVAKVVTATTIPENTHPRD